MTAAEDPQAECGTCLPPQEPWMAKHSKSNPEVNTETVQGRSNSDHQGHQDDE